MKHFLHYTFAFALLLVAQMGFAQGTDVLFDFDANWQTLFPDITAGSSGSGTTYVNSGDFLENQILSSGNVKVTITASTDVYGNSNRIWEAKTGRLRLYSGTMTVEALNGDKITGIAFTNNSTQFNMTADTGTAALGDPQTTASWTGEATAKIVLTINKNTQLRTMTVTLNGETTTPDGTDEHVFSNTLTTQAEFDLFTIDNVSLPSAATYIWKWGSANYGAMAFAYIQNTAYDAEAVLTSPVIDLTEYKDATLTFDHAVNKGAPTNLKVQVVEASAGGSAAKQAIAPMRSNTTTDITVPNWPAGKDWKFISSGAIDLTQYAGKKIQIAYRYVSTTTVCPTWEVKNIVVDGTKNATAITTIKAENAANAPLYNLQGQRVDRTAKGILIQNGRKFINK